MLFIQGPYVKIKHYCKYILHNGYYEFCFSYVPESESFREINRFIWESKHFNTRFKNKYHGHVVVDLSPWCENEPNEYFEAFLFFLKDNESDYDISFIAEHECNKKLMNKLKELFDFKIVDLCVEKENKKMPIGFCARSEEKEYV